MQITGVRRVGDGTPESGLVAGFAITFDDQLAIWEVKVVRRRDGQLLLRMPQTPRRDRCPKCSKKNALRANWCNWCGVRLARDRYALDQNGRPDLWLNVAHPVSAEFRQELEERVFAEVHRSP